MILPTISLASIRANRVVCPIACFHVQSAGLPDGSTSPIFAIRPNPASDYIRLDMVNPSSEGLLLILYDMQGKVVLSQTMNTADPIYIGFNLPGTYVCKVISTNICVVGKLLIRAK